MCNEAVHMKPLSLTYVLDHLKTEGMCIKAVEADPSDLRYIPDHLKHRKWKEEEDPMNLDYVPDQFKTQEMCNEAVHWYPYYFCMFLISIRCKICAIG